MQLWTDIVSNALLGTDKQAPVTAGWPEDFTTALTHINGNTAIDKEEKFLQLAALAFNYRQSGSLPLHKEDAGIPTASEEIRPGCSMAAIQAFNDVVAEDNEGLLQLWLECCAASQQIAHPYMLPALLDKAISQKALRPLVESCAGERGKWLAQFNPDWKMPAAVSLEEQWQTGTLAQRKAALAQLSETDPAAARAWLQQTWPQENANARADLLSSLRPIVFAEDSSWLEVLLNEKSVKVKEVVMHLLRMQPGSSIVKLYWQVAQQAISIKKEKALLGLSSKTTLQVKLPDTVDENIFKYGIERLSSNKKIPDEAYIVEQLVQAVPPHLWENHLQETPEKIITLFTEHSAGGRLYAALESAASKFRNAQWAKLLVAEGNRFYYPLVYALEPAEREPYIIRSLTKTPEDVMTYLRQEVEGEWSLPLTRAVLEYACKSPYSYNRLFFSKRAHQLPVEILASLDSISPQRPEQHVNDAWNDIRAHIKKLLVLKQQIINAFQ
ncbi:hypothetical protein F0L74_17590 [Chitinophaga agrisoli]|uniref:Uncharacterized protein n=1 Tax=Chitinophaga agrisoli TaxID=2607653 RepID=A0A5B2VSW0_9BACT|nr:DUF5691 domain-containing protein [Chitinophaga agrisoli]KAA2241688.1 hypothetical protein F0L74_17590 [Chitinophaga agrisoli]